MQSDSISSTYLQSSSKDSEERELVSKLLISRFSCRAPEHIRCFTSAGTDHCYLADDEFEHWVSTVLRGEATLAQPPSQLLRAPPLPQVKSKSFVPSTPSSTNLSSGVPGPGYSLGKGAKRLGERVLKGMIYPVAAFKVGALRQQWNNIMSGNVSLDEPAVIDRVTESFKGQLRVLCKDDTPSSVISDATGLMEDVLSVLDVWSFETCILPTRHKHVLRFISLVFYTVWYLHRNPDTDPKRRILSNVLYTAIIKQNTPITDRQLYADTTRSLLDILQDLHPSPAPHSLVSLLCLLMDLIQAAQGFQLSHGKETQQMFQVDENLRAYFKRNPIPPSTDPRDIRGHYEAISMCYAHKGHSEPFEKRTFFTRMFADVYSKLHTIVEKASSGQILNGPLLMDVKLALRTIYLLSDHIDMSEWHEIDPILEFFRQSEQFEANLVFRELRQEIRSLAIRRGRQDLTQARVESVYDIFPSIRSNQEPSEDPLATAMLPPIETPQQRDARLEKEREAKKVSDEIDEQLRMEATLTKGKHEIRLLLLGQRESGRSTLLKQLQLAENCLSHPEDRLAWRPVVYLKVVCIVQCIIDALHLPVHADTPRLSSIVADDSDSLDQASNVQPYIELKERLREFLELEEMLSSQGVTTWGGNIHIKAEGRVEIPSHGKSNRIHGSDDWWKDPSDLCHIMQASCADIQLLWADPHVQAELKRKRIPLLGSWKYYLDSIVRITSPQYVPSDEDVFHARRTTSGINEHTFSFPTGESNLIDWKFYEIRQSGSRAWTFLTDVTAVIFLAPLSTFDENLAEDPQVNRLEDTLRLWRALVQNQLWRNVDIILFFNKLDLLKTKLQAGIRFSDYVTSYRDRPNDYESITGYIRKSFLALHRSYTINRNRKVYLHMEESTDARSAEIIMTNVRDIILRHDLNESKKI